MLFNYILTDTDREQFKKEVELMQAYCPDMMSRKIGDAVVQQAFVLHTALDVAHTMQSEGTDVHILSAGSWEDTAGETLKKLGYYVAEVDPVINFDLHTFRLKDPKPFEIIISTSVLEHTEDDNEFISDAADLLCPGGYAIFTCDFLDGWQPGQRVPHTSRRFYTSTDLGVRLRSIIEARGCELVGVPDWSGRDRFQWEGIDYSFATFVFRKKLDA